MLTREERKQALIINLEAAEHNGFQFKLECEDIPIVLEALRKEEECQ